MPVGRVRDVEIFLLFIFFFLAEVGDFEADSILPGYVSEFKMLPKQTSKQEERIAELHQTLRFETANYLPVIHIKKYS